MSRRAPSWLATQIGHVYTLHFWPPYGDSAGQQAKHYTGWTREGNLAHRLSDHALGRGARLTQVQKQAGGSWVLADVEDGVTADRESQLKERGAGRRCTVCQTQRAVEAGRISVMEALAKAGWDRSNEAQRGTLLEIFGAGPDQAPPAPDVPALPEPRPFVPAPAVELASPEQLAELDALVDELCAQWAGRPKAEPAAAAAEPPAAAMTPLGLPDERAAGHADAPSSQTPAAGDLPGWATQAELEASA
jgi:predicted GIY-YIG superfamily endonuclease